MKLNLALLAKLYIFLFSLVHLDNIVSLLGINESMVSAPPYLSFWWWHVVFFLVYVVFPILTVCVDSYALYTMAAGVSLVGVLVRVLGVITWMMELQFSLVPFYVLAAFLSLILAVGNAAQEVSSQILCSTWSQF